MIRMIYVFHYSHSLEGQLVAINFVVGCITGNIITGVVEQIGILQIQIIFLNGNISGLKICLNATLTNGGPLTRTNHEIDIHDSSSIELTNCSLVEIGYFLAALADHNDLRREKVEPHVNRQRVDNDVRVCLTGFTANVPAIGLQCSCLLIAEFDGEVTLAWVIGVTSAGEILIHDVSVFNLEVIHS
nr:MAG TPA: hypothetical protein [Caudoviricetes sp.]